jgi:DNA-binding GntR family transcriptional regulator
VLVATLTQRRPTVASLAAATAQPRVVVHNALLWLRNEGLVTWVPGKQATLRATCRVVGRP